jgi:hypothetical protein
MPSVPLKLLTVVAEAVLADRLTKAMLDAGALGFTLTPAKGVGARNRHVIKSGAPNVRIEVLANAGVTQSLLAMLAEDWYPNHPMVAWVHDVDLTYSEQYLGDPAGDASQEIEVS